ncbi:MAG: FGGY family carbohydrate kinase [Steroidobacteraceae bacterium]
MQKAPCLLALDQGGHASRAFLWSATGELLAQHEVAVATRRIGEDRVEHDAGELLATLRHAIDVVLVRAPPGQQVLAGLATQRSSIVAWDRDSGLPLSPVLSWQDRRNARWLEGLRAQESRIRALTGLPLTAHYGASKMRWCLQHLDALGPVQANGTLVLGPLSSYLVQGLCGGAPRVDPANASRTQLWDIATRDWSSELLSLFGIDARCLPQSVDSDADFGEIRGVSTATRLRLVTGDQSTVPFLFGPPSSEDIFVNLGTGAFVQRATGAEPVHLAGLLSSILCSGRLGTHFCVEGTVNGAGSATALVAKGLGRDEPGLWRDLESAAAIVPVPYFNAVSGLGSPFWASHLHSGFLGDGSPLQHFAGVVESIAFLLAANVIAMRVMNPAPQRVVLTGGLSRSGWLCQRLADLLGGPVTVPSVREATVHGLRQMLGVDSTLVAAATTDYPPRDNPALRARYERWLDELAGRGIRAAITSSTQLG